MAAKAIRGDEALGLGLAIAAHVALAALLVLRPAPVQVTPPPEKMIVTLSDNVGLTATAPQTAEAAAPDEAPTLGEPPAPAPEPEPVQKVEAPRPASVQPVPPKPVVAKPLVPKPLVKASPPPRQQPVLRANPDVIGRLGQRPDPRVTPAKPAQKSGPAPRASSPVTPPRAAAGGSRIGDDFLRGVPGSRASGPAQTAPAAAIGPAVRSALAGAISRQLKPRWVAPQGVDADKLVTLLTWSLNRDGTLAGAPRVIRQDGINDANRAQAARHAEQAIRAVQLAAPFTLPPEYYDAWKRVAEFRFDRRLAQ